MSLRQTRLARQVLALVLFTAGYIVVGQLGAWVAFQQVGASPVLPASGIALAGALLLGVRAGPAIFAAAFIVSQTTGAGIATSLGSAVGSTVEAVLGAGLLRRWAGGRRPFTQVRTTVAFAVLAAGASTLVGATIVAVSLALGGHAPRAELIPTALTWWLGAATGDLVVGSTVLLWVSHPRPRWLGHQQLEAAALLASLLVIGLVVFGAGSPVAARHYPVEFLCIPVLLWAAFRFGAREAATAVLLLSALAIRGTLQGLGPFVRDTPTESLLLLDAFTAVSAVISLVVAAVVAERRHVETRLRELSVRDPLTGLANYRQLVAVLQQEIERSGRTERPFALVFLDMDELKAINDLYGHLVGSRALCRLAEVLRRTCRAVDTVARYGGDEFAVVLPETSESAALEMARRVMERLAADREIPPLTVSLGVAVYPRDGDTGEALLGWADRVLYQMKSGRTPPLKVFLSRPSPE